MKTLAAFVAVSLIVIVGAYVQVVTWNECRSIHSFLYCMARQ